jgi:hypothetical protein
MPAGWRADGAALVPEAVAVPVPPRDPVGSAAIDCATADACFAAARAAEAQGDDRASLDADARACHLGDRRGCVHAMRGSELLDVLADGDVAWALTFAPLPDARPLRDPYGNGAFVAGALRLSRVARDGVRTIELGVEHRAPPTEVQTALTRAGDDVLVFSAEKPRPGTFAYDGSVYRVDATSLATAREILFLDDNAGFFPRFVGGRVAHYSFARRELVLDGTGAPLSFPLLAHQYAAARLGAVGLPPDFTHENAASAALFAWLVARYG